MEAIRIYNEMLANNIRPDRATLITVLVACGDIPYVDYGFKIYTQITKEFDRDGVADSAFISFLGKCGYLQQAYEVFLSIPSTEKGVGQYNSIMNAASNNGEGTLALKLYDELKKLGTVKPNAPMFVSITSI